MQKRFLVGLLFLLVPLAAHAATLSLYPAAVSVPVGGTFSERIVVSSPDVSINAATGQLSFPTDVLSAVSLSESGSIMTLWAQDPSFINGSPNGTAEFAGVMLNPGWIGTNGTVITATFKAVHQGTAYISFNNAQVLANDGKGTNVLTATLPAKITVNVFDSSSTAVELISPTSTPAPVNALPNTTSPPPASTNSISTLLQSIIVALLLTILVLVIVGLYLVQRHRETVSQSSSETSAKLLEDLKHLETDIHQIEEDLINRK